MNTTYLILGISVVLIAAITIMTTSLNSENMNVDSLNVEEYDEIISIGTVAPDASKMIKRFQPTADYIAQNLSGEKKFKGEVIITKTLEDMELLLEKQEIDLYYDSPFGVVYLAEETGGKVILNRWKENAEYYTTVYFVKNESKIMSMNDLRGSTIIFQSPESTTGFMLPVATLNEKGFRIGHEINNEINYIFSGDDENTPHWIIEGRGDAGVTSNIDFESLPDELRSKFRIIGETKEIPRQLVMNRSDMDLDMVKKIKDILLTMHETETGMKILEEFKHTSKYTESQKEEYEQINNMLKFLPPGIID